jgi:hypothetical protein
LVFDADRHVYELLDCSGVLAHSDRFQGVVGVGAGDFAAAVGAYDAPR